MGIEIDSDFLLIQRMRLGNEAALESFVTKYYPMILKYCQIRISDYGYAEDMTQETFVHFFRTLEQYKHYGKAANYLYTIAANLCLDYHRRKKELIQDEIPESVDNNSVSPENKVIMSEAFSLLPDDLKETAILYFVQELKQKDIAAVLNLNISLVKYRVRKARQLLSSYFREEDL